MSLFSNQKISGSNTFEPQNVFVSAFKSNQTSQDACFTKFLARNPFDLGTQNQVLPKDAIQIQIQKLEADKKNCFSLCDELHGNHKKALLLKQELIIEQNKSNQLLKTESEIVKQLSDKLDYHKERETQLKSEVDHFYDLIEKESSNIVVIRNDMEQIKARFDKSLKDSRQLQIDLSYEFSDNKTVELMKKVMNSRLRIKIFEFLEPNKMLSLQILNKHFYNEIATKFFCEIQIPQIKFVCVGDEALNKLNQSRKPFLNLQKHLPFNIDLKRFQIKEISYQYARNFVSPLQIGFKNGFGTKSESFIQYEEFKKMNPFLDREFINITNIPENKKITSIGMYEKKVQQDGNLLQKLGSIQFNGEDQTCFGHSKKKNIYSELRTIKLKSNQYVVNFEAIIDSSTGAIYNMTPICINI